MTMARRFGFVSMTITSLLCACAPQATRPPAIAPAPTVAVPAAGETVAVGTANADAADDPAIFARADNAGFDFAGAQHRGVILGTDKKAGLYVFGLDGRRLQFLPDGLLNNVDLRPSGDGFVAGASDRGRMGVALYRFTGAGQVQPAGFIKSDVVEPYGFCMGMLNGQMIAVLIAKDGGVREYVLSEANGQLSGSERRRYAVGSQSEGCVVDDATGALYIGEELKGLWRYSLTGDPAARVLVEGVTSGRLIPDVEGVTLIRDRAETFLIVSSQGDSGFAVWQLANGTETYVGRYRVAAANGVDEVTGTDGLDAWSGAIGGFPGGLVVTQDDVNDGQRTQNFKLVDWQAIRAALGK